MTPPQTQLIRMALSGLMTRVRTGMAISEQPMDVTPEMKPPTVQASAMTT